MRQYLVDNLGIYEPQAMRDDEVRFDLT